MSATFVVETESRYQIVDVTDRVQALVPPEAEGVCFLFVQHTTAAFALAAVQDGAGEDLLETLPHLVPQLDFKHQPPEHVPGHILASIYGASVGVPVAGGRLQLGDVQRIVLLEFQGPSKRTISLSILAKTV